MASDRELARSIAVGNRQGPLVPLKVKHLERRHRLCGIDRFTIAVDDKSPLVIWPNWDEFCAPHNYSPSLGRLDWMCNDGLSTIADQKSASRKSARTVAENSFRATGDMRVGCVFGIRIDEAPQGLRMLLGAFRGGSSLERIVGVPSLWS